MSSIRSAGSLARRSRRSTPSPRRPYLTLPLPVTQRALRCSAPFPAGRRGWSRSAGDFRWAAEIPKDGETKIVVDTLTQLFYVYRGDRLVGVSTISSGKKGRETPLGFWSVMLKKKLGYSRKYDNAPMPFMQMYDEKGIAFHAGPNPGYPASHGCVRLPLKFAEKLFGLTKMGTKVIIEG